VQVLGQIKQKNFTVIGDSAHIDCGHPIHLRTIAGAECFRRSMRQRHARTLHPSFAAGGTGPCETLLPVVEEERRENFGGLVDDQPRPSRPLRDATSRKPSRRLFTVGEGFLWLVARRASHSRSGSSQICRKMDPGLLSK